MMALLCHNYVAVPLWSQCSYSVQSSLKYFRIAWSIFLLFSILYYSYFQSLIDQCKVQALKLGYQELSQIGYDLTSRRILVYVNMFVYKIKGSECTPCCHRCMFMWWVYNVITTIGHYHLIIQVVSFGRMARL